MKLRAALLAVALALAPLASHGALVDPKEPPATPAGGKPEAGIGVTGAVGLAILAGVILVLALDDDDDGPTATTATATATGTR